MLAEMLLKALITRTEAEQVEGPELTQFVHSFCHNFSRFSRIREVRLHFMSAQRCFEGAY